VLRVGTPLPDRTPRRPKTGTVQAKRHLPPASPRSPRAIHALQLTLTIIDEHGILTLNGEAELQQQVIKIVLFLAFGLPPVRPTPSRDKHLRCSHTDSFPMGTQRAMPL